MALYAAVVICGLAAGLLVYRYDLYQREPWHALLLTAAAGAVAMRLAERVERALLIRYPGDASSAAAAAVVEELFRLVLVVALAVLFRHTFDDPMDGVVYGSVLGLGMGLEESLSLLEIVSRVGWSSLPVEVVRLCGHLVMGGITGYGVGMARMGLPRWRRELIVTVAASISLHFAWDWIALFRPGSVAAALLQTLAAVCVMLAGMLFYGVLVVTASERSRQFFAPDSALALWGWPFHLLRAAPRRAPSPPPRAAERGPGT